MHSSATAGIEFQGATMRYAEIEQFGAQVRLLRLGDCDFEFDVTQVLFRGGEQRYLDIVRNALSEIFVGSTSSLCRVAVHTPAARLFHSSSPASFEADRQASQLSFESHLLYEGVEAGDRRIVTGLDWQGTDTLKTEPQTVSISEIPASIHRRIAYVATELKGIEMEPVSGTGALMSVLRRLTPPDRAKANELIVGLREDGTQFSVGTVGRNMFHQVRREVGAGDIAYFALHSLRSAGVRVEDLHSVRYYGSNGSSDILGNLENALGRRVEPLNPMPIVDIEADRFEEDFRFEPFVLCLGAAL